MNSEMNTSMQSRRIPGDSSDAAESDFDCYQNYMASEVFVQGIAGIVNQGDVELIVRAQKQMLQRFEKTNEMLLNCNLLSNGRLKMANDDFKKHIKLINDMKKDLDYIFKKIRNIKARIGTQYPQAMKKVEQRIRRSSLSEEYVRDDDNDHDGENNSTVSVDKRSSANNTQTADSIKHKQVEKEFSTKNVTVNYVQMETNADNGQSANVDGKSGGNDGGIVAIEGKAFDESTDNESSDCTTDT